MRRKETPRTRLGFVMLASVLCLATLLAGCDPLDPPYQYLEMVNGLPGAVNYIKSVSLVGYEFRYLSIYPGSSQVFSLDQGMPGGYTDINVVVSYGVVSATWTVSNTFDFENLVTTTVTLKDDGTVRLE